jgi:hypothetical protein
MITCKRCAVEKSTTEFYSTPSGHRLVCRSCLTSETVERQRLNPEAQRWKQLKHRYGLTKENWHCLITNQKGLCPICSVILHTEPVKRSSKRPANQAVVDHCHETGIVRAILCHSCNVAIGHMNDDINRLKSAIKYLRKMK